jgi:hypothetical protein
MAGRYKIASSGPFLLLRMLNIRAIWHWRELHNEELHNLYSLSNIIRDEVRENEMGMACSTHGEGRRPLRIHRCKWENIINMNFGQIIWCGQGWIYLSQDRDQFAALWIR